MTEPRRPGLTFLLSSPWALLALGFGTGLSPLAPGTVGSLLGIPLAFGLRHLPPGWQAAIWIALFMVGCRACERAGRALGTPDHPAIVWDEVCAMALVLLLAPPGPVWIVPAFAAFRLFDIVKPWPIHVIDRNVQNGFGVMADDFLAAAYAVAAIAIIHAAVT